MTSIVGVRCKDGVVIAADSSATFGDGSHHTIEQQTDKKIELIEDNMIVAGTGAVGHHQRFSAVAARIAKDAAFKKGTPLSCAKMLSKQGLEDFSLTHVLKLEYGAIVAYVADGQPVLCEFPQGGMHPEVLKYLPMAFQPELKNDLWFASVGSGQPLTDPFLALLRKVFWPGEPPEIQGGIFMAHWALMHACELNPGGIKEPIHIAVLAKKEDGTFATRFLTDAEKAEHRDIISGAMAHMAQFKDILEGKAGAEEPPQAPAPAA
jgi:hypothetical protein